MSTQTSRSQSAQGVTTPWTALRRSDKTGEAWRQVHRALAVAGEVPMLWADRQQAYHHLAFSYCHSCHALVSGPIRGSRPFRVGLRVHDSTMLLMGESKSVLQQFSMTGKPIFEARTWLLEHAEAMAAEPARNDPIGQARLDAHPLGEGAPYGTGLESGFVEVDRAYADADGVLRRVLADLAPGTAVRVWPHHADIAALIDLESDGEDPLSIGLGLAPADDRITQAYDRHGEAYFYAAPWPSPRGAEPPALSNGTWLTQGALLAALPLSSVTDLADSKQQSARVEQFLREAYAACEQLL